MIPAGYNYRINYVYLVEYNNYYDLLPKMYFQCRRENQYSSINYLLTR